MGMIRTLAFLCAALGLSGSAFAADLPPAPPPRAPAVYVPPVLPVYNWSGVYLGINGGYGFGSSEWTDPLNPSVSTSSGSFNTNGGLAGGTLGVNFQTGGFVFGAEGDWDWQGLQGKSSSPFCTGVFTSGTVGATAAGLSCETKSDWIATIRARAGYAADRVLFYATGGGAAGNVQTGLNTLSLQSNTEYGWTAGAGIEWAFADNWTAKVEYLYVDLGNSTCNNSASCGFDAPATATTAAVPANDTVKFTESMIRAGVNFKFNGW
jgi:outer membrane immunogenic protein